MLKKEVIKFFKINKEIYILFYLFQILMWSYITITPTILLKSFNYKEEILSFGTNLSLITFLITSTFLNIRLENKINILKKIIYANIAVILNILFLICLMYFKLDDRLFLLIKIFEGISIGTIFTLYGFLFKVLLIKKNNNNIINSINQSIIYSLKTIIPIIITGYFIVKNQEYLYLIIPITITLILLIYIFKNKKRIFIKFQSKINTYHGKQHSHKSFKESIKVMFKFYKGKQKEKKILYSIFLILQNSMRPFYDLYMILYLVKGLNFSIFTTTILISFMVIGQASQFISSLLLKRLGTLQFRIIGLLLLLIGYISIINYPELIKEKIYIGYLIFYIIGFARSFAANYEYKFVMELGKTDKLNQIEFISLLLREISHNAAYLIGGVLLYLNYKIINMMNITYILIVLSIILWYFIEIKYQIFKE